jgi:hypothetical protein
MNGIASRFTLYPGADLSGLRSALLTLVKKTRVFSSRCHSLAYAAVCAMKNENECHVMEHNYLCLRFSPDARHGNNKGLSPDRLGVVEAE